MKIPLIVIGLFLIHVVTDIIYFNLTKEEKVWEIIVQKTLQEQGTDSYLLAVMCLYDSTAVSKGTIPNGDDWNKWLKTYLTNRSRDEKRLLLSQVKMLLYGMYDFLLNFQRTNDFISLPPTKRIDKVELAWWKRHRLPEFKKCFIN